MGISTMRRIFMRMLALGTTLPMPLTLASAASGTVPVQAESHTMPVSDKIKGNSATGQAIFNGKGYCFQCHGREGHIDQRPAMSPELDRMITQMNPPPANLRNPASLKSKNNAERFQTIKEGHSGTAMLPKKDFLSDQDIRDLLAYLDTLRADVINSGKP